MTDTNIESLDASFQFSDKAAIKIATLIEEEGNPNLNFRIYITGGGCSGFQYGITFDDVLHDDDTIIEKSCPDSDQKIKLVIDSMSYPYLKSARIDFKESPEQFVISNPNAKTTCGCGSSFTLEDDD